MSTLQQRVIDTISQIMCIAASQLGEESSPDTVENWDSLAHMHLILALEEKFSVSFTEEEILDLFSIDSIVDVLRKKQQRGPVLPG